MSQFRSTRVEVNGWVVLDKPIGMTSTHAVSRLRRIFNAKKAGHAGTLDPLASGILPIAFGEATKTVPFVQDGEKAYRFEVRWAYTEKPVAILPVKIGHAQCLDEIGRILLENLNDLSRRKFLRKITENMNVVSRSTNRD